MAKHTMETFHKGDLVTNKHDKFQTMCGTIVWIDGDSICVRHRGRLDFYIPAELRVVLKCGR